MNRYQRFGEHGAETSEGSGSQGIGPAQGSCGEPEDSAPQNQAQKPQVHQDLQVFAVGMEGVVADAEDAVFRIPVLRVKYLEGTGPVSDERALGKDRQGSGPDELPHLKGSLLLGTGVEFGEPGRHRKRCGGQNRTQDQDRSEEPLPGASGLPQVPDGDEDRAPCKTQKASPGSAGNDRGDGTCGEKSCQEVSEGLPRLLPDQKGGNPQGKHRR